MKKILLKIGYLILFTISAVLWLAVSGVFIRFDTARGSSFQELYDQRRLGRQTIFKKFNAAGLYYERYCFFGVQQVYVYGKFDQSTIESLKNQRQRQDLSYARQLQSINFNFLRWSLGNLERAGKGTVIG